MPVELKVPEVGESVSQVQIGRWLKNEGDAIGKDDPLVEIETDKITVELPSPVEGRLTQLLKQQGDEAAVGDVIGYVEEGAAGEPASAGGAKAQTPAPKSAEKSTTPKQPQPKRAPASTETDADDVYVMPAAQRLLDEHGLSPDQVTPTGPGGRLLKEDVQRHLDQATASPGEPASAGGSASSASTPATPHRPPATDREEESVPMSPMRRKIAQRLVEAQQTAALLTTFNELDMTEVMALRSRYKEDFQKTHGVKLGFMSFFVKASIEALKAFPGVNGEIRGDNIIYKNYYDIGIAIGGGKGLVVPVLRDADRLSFAGVEKAIGDFAQKVKDNKLALEDLQGGTFTITNGGIFGSMLSTPIINPPQSGVLGMHAITERPMAVEGEVKIRPMMYLALTYDHRLVDGREAVSFLKRLKDLLEDPARLLMEV